MYSSRNWPRSSSVTSRARPAGGKVGSLRENPRIAQHAAADEDAFDAEPHPVDNLLRFDAVAAAEHRDRQDRRRSAPRDPSPRTRCSSAPPSGRARRRLRRPRPRTIRASVGAFRSSSFQPARILTVTGILTALVIAAINRRGVSRLAHQAAAGVVLGDLRHRAAHVDVDDVGAHAFDDLRGRGHLVRIAAENLNRDRPFLFGVFRVLERPVDPAHEPFGADHLGDDETAAAMALDQTTKRRVGHPAMGATANGDASSTCPIRMSNQCISSAADRAKRGDERVDESRAESASAVTPLRTPYRHRSGAFSCYGTRISIAALHFRLTEPMSVLQHHSFLLRSPYWRYTIALFARRSLYRRCSTAFSCYGVRISVALPHFRVAYTVRANARLCCTVSDGL